MEIHLREIKQVFISLDLEKNFIVLIRLKVPTLRTITHVYNSYVPVALADLANNPPVDI